MMRVGLFAFAAIWVLIAVPTIVARAPYECGALLSPDCLLQMANWFGDVVTFQWGSQWATLTGSFVAILAAVIGATAISRQNNEAERRHQADRMRRAESFRASMPLAVSSVSAYLEEIASICADHHSNLSINGYSRPITFPPIPAEAIPTLQGVVEFEVNDEVRNAIVELIGSIQLVHARSSFRSISNYHVIQFPTLMETEGLLFTICDCYAKNDGLYGYARGSDEGSEPFNARIWNSASVLLPNLHSMSHLLRQISRAYGPRP